MNGSVTYDVDGQVAIVRIKRPEKKNAINRAVAIELHAAWQRFNASDERVAILAGEGDEAFTSGADLSDLPELWRCVPGVGVIVDKPIIAATSGYCIGGGMILVQACDLCVAAESTQFIYPEARLGFSGGMIAGMAARVPHKIAMEVMLLGNPMSAARAYEIGYVNRVVADGTHIQAALEMARELAKNAPLVLAMLKRFVCEQVLPRGPSELMGAALREVDRINTSDDFREGIASFREKRKARFSGR